MRGQAYHAAHKASEAVAEFQEVLHHLGIMVSDPIGALARLQLGAARDGIELYGPADSRYLIDFYGSQFRYRRQKRSIYTRITHTGFFFLVDF